VLDNVEIFNCHGRMLLATVPKSAQQFMDLASKVLNHAHGSWINQRQCYVYEDFWRKSEREIEEFFGFLDLDLNSVMINSKAVWI
jgi:hypothetical protein